MSIIAKQVRSKVLDKYKIGNLRLGDQQAFYAYESVNVWMHLKSATVGKQ